MDNKCKSIRIRNRLCIIFSLIIKRNNNNNDIIIIIYIGLKASLLALLQHTSILYNLITSFVNYEGKKKESGYVR